VACFIEGCRAGEIGAADVLHPGCLNLLFATTSPRNSIEIPLGG